MSNDVTQARAALLDAMTNPTWFSIPSIPEADELIDGYAHALAEQIRAVAGPTDDGHLFMRGVRHAADLIDPEAQR